jgi:hypothetical protein
MATDLWRLSTRKSSPFPRIFDFRTRDEDAAKETVHRVPRIRLTPRPEIDAVAPRVPCTGRWIIFDDPSHHQRIEGQSERPLNVASVSTCFPDADPAIQPCPTDRTFTLKFELTCRTKSQKLGTSGRDKPFSPVSLFYRGNLRRESL